MGKHIKVLYARLLAKIDIFTKMGAAGKIF